MKGKEKKGKRLVAHERAIELLREDPYRHFYTISKLYATGTVVPAKDIPKLVKALQQAGQSTGLSLDPSLRLAIQALRKQQAEAKKEQRKKKKEEET